MRVRTLSKDVQLDSNPALGDGQYPPPRAASADLPIPIIDFCPASPPQECQCLVMSATLLGLGSGHTSPSAEAVPQSSRDEPLTHTIHWNKANTHPPELIQVLGQVQFVTYGPMRHRLLRNATSDSHAFGEVLFWWGACSFARKRNTSFNNFPLFGVITVHSSQETAPYLLYLICSPLLPHEVFRTG